MSVWYRVRDLDAGKAFYRDVLGFKETFHDQDGRWAQLQRGDMVIALWEAQGDEGGVASVEVPDLQAEVERLRAQGVDVGIDRRAARAVRIVDVSTRTGTASSSRRRSTVIRPAGAQDLPFLRDMLRHAYYARWGTEADVPLERYVAGWGRPGDEALVAIDEFQPVGAAWFRLFEQDEPGYGFVDEETPGADDRDRPEPPRPRARRAAARRAPRARARGRATRRSASASSRTTRRSTCTSSTASSEVGERAGAWVMRARSPSLFRGASSHSASPSRGFCDGVRCMRGENQAGRKFCGECGEALAAVCAACGSANTPGVKFCGECGTAARRAERRSPAAGRSPSGGSSRCCSPTSSASPPPRRAATRRTTASCSPATSTPAGS